MKQLELNLQKRLLIVELEVDFIGAFIDEYSLYTKVEGDDIYWHSNDVDVKKANPICKGSELTEEITEDLVIKFGETPHFSYYISHTRGRGYYITAIESFISSIESKGYYWSENPYKKELDKCNEYTDMFTIAKRSRAFEEAEFRTFNPDKTLIFEIL